VKYDTKYAHAMTNDNWLLFFWRSFLLNIKVLFESRYAETAKIGFTLSLQFPDLNTLWRVEWCLTLPRDTSRRIEKSDRLETGIGAMIVQSNKILYVVSSTASFLRWWL